MRFSVRPDVQGALFREVAVARVRFSVSRPARMRFSVSRRHVCAGEKKRILRKSAFWGFDVTERRILEVTPQPECAFP